MIRPITPDEVDAAQIIVPDAVFHAFNIAIVRGWDGKKSTVIRDEVCTHISDLLGMCATEVFDRGYLDVADIYRSSGWAVKSKQGKAFEVYFTFSK
jgi:hypothetical protein